jgi:uncharacterized membrane protein YhaH (DUF805 family)
LNSQFAPPVAQPVLQPAHFSQLDFGTSSTDAPKSMKFIESIRFSYKNYAKFKGRASRSEYWYWQLYSILGAWGSAFIGGFLGAFFAEIFGADGTQAASLGIAAYYLFGLSVTIPTLARGVRRLHDIGKSGWNLFFMFIPIVGGILLLVWLCRDGGPDNEYGPAV